MTLVGSLVLIAFLLSTAFLYLHGRTSWWERPAGVAVFVMAVVTFLVMLLATLRITFGLVPPEWVRAAVYLGIIVGLGWKTVTIIRYEYGYISRSTDSLNPGSRHSDQEETKT